MAWARGEGRGGEGRGGGEKVAWLMYVHRMGGWAGLCVVAMQCYVVASSDLLTKWNMSSLRPLSTSDSHTAGDDTQQVDTH